ncbi:TadE family type IV pilus minor pilin [Streptomyces sp. FZ201]|uniref:TadE family type IV pilus minor pilin n=1 Tax=Streptomyces sp. FZ201 TaxID=3057122 RepID=UPI0021BE838D|nr:TadE family type IV pilus minor pilin [Streptomyces sp. FZ201]
MRGCEGRRADRGFVTAETALVLPVLVMFTMALVWGLLVVAAQIQCVDAARTGARAAARQDPPDQVVAVTREAAPSGAEITVSRSEGLVRVRVVAEPPVLGGLPFEVREEAVAVAEEARAAGDGLGQVPTSAPAAGARAGRLP